MITLKQYNDNPNLIEELKSTYGQDKLIDIFLNLELMNLRNKLDSSVLCMDELSNEIDLLIDRLNQKINLWDASVFSIDLDTVIRYIKISLLDIVVYNGSYFSMYHDDIFYSLVNCYTAYDDKEYSQLVEYIYTLRYTSTDVAVLKSINKLYLQKMKFNCYVVDLDSTYIVLLGKGLL